MVKVFHGNVKNVSYTLLQQEIPTEKLAIILPGKGYNVKAPLLHYSTGICFNKNFDVLHINYEYNHKEFSHLGEQIHQIQEDVDAVVCEVLTNHHYEQFCLIGKSIGTIGLSHLVGQEIFQSATVIWLTPLLMREYVFLAMQQCGNKGLVFIGDQDPCFQENRFHVLRKNTNLSLNLIEGVNHSLDFSDNPLKSIDILKKIIEEIDLFTRR